MSFRGIGILLPVVTGKTQCGRRLLEQRLIVGFMAVMAGQAFAFFIRRMHTACLGFFQVMAALADLSRFFFQHTSVVAAMHGMTCLAIAFLNRIVLGRGGYIVMTG